MNTQTILKEIIPDSKVVMRKKERCYDGQKGIETLDELCFILSRKTKSDIFNTIMNKFKKVKIICSSSSKLLDDCATTSISIDNQKKITSINYVDIPELTRFSMMFYPYLYEGCRVLYFSSRIGMEWKYEHEIGSHILPHFVTLYAIDNSKDLFDIETIKAAKSLYVVALYNGLTQDLKKFNISKKVPALLNLDVIAIMKAVTLYEMINKNKDFYNILNAITDNTNSIGKELDYNNKNLDINSKNVTNYCLKFIKDNAYCLYDD